MKWIPTLAGALLVIYIGCSWIDRFQEEQVTGKRVLITGASTGIGEQLAYHYAQLGAKIVITARTEEKLQKVITKCNELRGGDYSYVPADMSNINAYQDVIKKTAEKLGGLDYLVLNHIAVSPMGEWLGQSENMTLLENVMDVNFRAYVHLTSYALPMLEKSGGSIIVVSSIAGKVGMPYTASYSASKFALDGFFSALRQELQLRGSNVSVTLVVLGFIATDNAVTGISRFGLNNIIEVVDRADPADAALAIIKGGALREREVYFPYIQAYPTILFRDWATPILEAYTRYLYARS